MTPKFTRPAAALAATACLAVAVPALAQTAAPTPGCAGSYSDKKGDASPDNVDITAFWFDYVGGKTYANIQVANLTKDLPDQSTGVNWYVLWTLDDVQNFVTAQIEAPSSEPTFGYGTVKETPNGTLRQQAGETPGQFFEGANGVIRIEIPAEVGGASGKVLKSPTSDTKTSLGIPGVASSLRDADEATGKTYTVNACTAPTPAEPVAPPPPAPTSSAPSGDSSAPSSQREVKKNKLTVSVSKKLPRATKVSKTLALKVSGSASNIDAGLFRGAPSANKVVGKGHLSSVNGKARLKLKLSKKLKKGSYTLYMVGKNRDDSIADRTVKLRFK